MKHLRLFKRNHRIHIKRNEKSESGKWKSPVSSQDYGHRPFVDKDVAQWGNNQFFKQEGNLQQYGGTEDAEAKKRSKTNCLHIALRPVLTFALLSGLFPVSGITSDDTCDLRFKWISWRFLYSMFMINISAIIAILAFIRTCLTKINLASTGVVVFDITAVFNLILFIRLARRWEGLMKEVSTSETVCPFPPRLLRRWTLKTKFSVFFYALMIVSIVEHGLSVASASSKAYVCKTEESFIRYYYFTIFSNVFAFIEFSIWKGVLLQVWSLIITLTWNFVDLFLVLMSLAMVYRFDQLSDWMDTTIGKRVSEKFWFTARVEFLRLSRLVKSVDSHINTLMAVSFASNLFIICEQMFNSLNTGKLHEEKGSCGRIKERLRWPDMIDTAYFGFSFVYLMFRFLAVSLSAAMVHSAAKRPKDILHLVPSYNYCTEVQRFLDQVSTDEIALTGHGLFTITRGLILKIAGTVITYELVLVQFNATPESSNSAKDAAINSTLA